MSNPSLQRTRKKRGPLSFALGSLKCAQYHDAVLLIDAWQLVDHSECTLPQGRVR